MSKILITGCSSGFGLETASLFLERGWEGTSIDEVSRQSGVAKTFIYARYPDKEALFAGAIERLMERASLSSVRCWKGVAA